MTAKLIFMPWYIGDYFADTAHLSTEGHGAYLLLLASYWMRGAPEDDDEQLASITRLPPERWKHHRPKLAPFFQIQDGKWRHKRVEAELVKARDLSERRREAGKKGASARYGSDDGTATANAEANAQLGQWQPDRQSESQSPLQESHSTPQAAPHLGAALGGEEKVASREGGAEAARLDVRESVAILDEIQSCLPNNPRAQIWDATRITYWRTQGYTREDILAGVRRKLVAMRPEEISGIGSLKFFDGPISDVRRDRTAPMVGALAPKPPEYYDTLGR